jgi:hypothetical protein
LQELGAAVSIHTISINTASIHSTSITNQTTTGTQPLHRHTLAAEDTTGGGSTLTICQTSTGTQPSFRHTLAAKATADGGGWLVGLIFFSADTADTASSTFGILAATARPTCTAS